MRISYAFLPRRERKTAHWLKKAASPGRESGRRADGGVIYNPHFPGDTIWNSD